MSILERWEDVEMASRDQSSEMFGIGPIELLLGLVATAVESLCQLHPDRSFWTEDDYNIGVAAILRRDATELPIHINYQMPTKELAGAAKNSPVIDLAITFYYRPGHEYYGIEGKVLTVKSQRSWRPKKTIDYYIDEGISRFLEGKYAQDVPRGAMLAYLVSGDHLTIATRVNEGLEVRAHLQTIQVVRFVKTHNPRFHEFDSSFMRVGGEFKMDHAIAIVH